MDRNLIRYADFVPCLTALDHAVPVLRTLLPVDDAALNQLGGAIWLGIDQTTSFVADQEGQPPCIKLATKLTRSRSTLETYVRLQGYADGSSEVDICLRGIMIGAMAHASPNLLNIQAWSVVTGTPAWSYGWRTGGQTPELDVFREHIALGDQLPPMGLRHELGMFNQSHVNAVGDFLSFIIS